MYVLNVNLLQTNSVCISMCVFIVCMYLLYVLHIYEEDHCKRRALRSDGSYVIDVGSKRYF